MTKKELQELKRQERAETARINIQESEYSTGLNMLADSLRLAIQTALQSNNPDIKAQAEKASEYLNSNFANWEEVVSNPDVVKEVKRGIDVYAQYDDSLLGVKDLLNDAVATASKTNEEIEYENERKRSWSKQNDTSLGGRIEEGIDKMTGKKYWKDTVTGEITTDFDTFAERLEQVALEESIAQGNTINDGIENSGFMEGLRVK
jgi:hypothetical protein